MAFNSRALVKSVKDNSDILMYTGVGYILAMLITVIVYSFSGQVANGNIELGAGGNESVTALAGGLDGTITTITAVFAAIAGFVIIVALMSAFGIKLSLGGKGKDM